MLDELKAPKASQRNARVLLKEGEYGKLLDVSAKDGEQDHDARGGGELTLEGAYRKRDEGHHDHVVED